MTNVTVPLSRPLLGGKVTSLTFREPRFEDVMLLGEPTMPLALGGDRFLPSPVPQIVKGYAERLLVSDSITNVNTMADASLKDTLAIQKVILGFFEEAARLEKSDDLPKS